MIPHNWPYRGFLAALVWLIPTLAFAQQGVPIGPIGVSNSVGPGGGFPITIGSTSIAANSTTTTIAGLTLTSSPTIGSGGNSTQQIIFSPNSGSNCGFGMANGGSQLLTFCGNTKGAGFSINNFTQRSDGTLQWATGSDPTSTVGSGISIISSALFAFGNGTQGDFSGTIQATAYKAGATAGASCTVNTPAHLTVVNGIVTLCN